jgi:glycosyltransferase involved in cell wall biosynthesis
VSFERAVIHQFHYNAAPKDAVTNQMIFLRQALAESGIVGNIYASEIRDADLLGVRRFDPTEARQGDLLLVHHSQGNPELTRVLDTPIPKALVYHNITPGVFYRHDRVLASLCDLGRRQLIQFRGKVTACFADSRYNAAELAEMGLPGAKELPLFDLSDERGQRRFPPKGPADGGDILFVGRIAPHKNQALLLKTQFYLSRMQRKDFRLVLVGSEDPVYADYLRLLAKALKIEDRVSFPGRVTEPELDAIYAKAAAFVSVSLHEGFGIPLVEAMRFGVPVFAFPDAAVKETLGGAGVTLRTKKPHRIAEVIAAALEDKNCVAAMLQSQAQRLEELKKIQNKTRAQRLLSSLLGDFPVESVARLDRTV